MTAFILCICTFALGIVLGNFLGDQRRDATIQRLRDQLAQAAKNDHRSPATGRYTGA